MSWAFGNDDPDSELEANRSACSIASAFVISGMPRRRLEQLSYDDGTSIDEKVL